MGNGSTNRRLHRRMEREQSAQRQTAKDSSPTQDESSSTNRLAPAENDNTDNTSAEPTEVEEGKPHSS